MPRPNRGFNVISATRISEDAKAGLERLAEQHGHSYSDEVRIALNFYLDAKAADSDES